MGSVGLHPILKEWTGFNDVIHLPLPCLTTRSLFMVRSLTTVSISTVRGGRGSGAPLALLASLSESAEVKTIADQVEKDTIAIIKAAK